MLVGGVLQMVKMKNWVGRRHTLMLDIAPAFLVCVGCKAKVITALCREIVVT